MAKKIRSSELKVAVIGVGSMGQNHVRVYSQMDSVSLVAIADPDISTLKSVASKYRVKEYLEYREMLEREELDIISIAVPTRAHFRVAIDVIKRGVNLLVEKPLTATSWEGEKIIRQAKEKGVVLGVGHVERFNPVVTELKRYLTDGKIGRVFQVTISRIGPFPPRVKDVGVFLDLATHDLDLMCYLIDSKVKRVSSESLKVIHKEHEDIAVGLLRFDNDIIGILNDNWLSPTKIRQVVVNGERGMYVADLLTQDLYFYENNYTPSPWESLQVFRGMAEGDMTRFHIKRDEPLRLELEAFVKSVLKGKPFLISGGDGLRSVKLALRLIKNADKSDKKVVREKLQSSHQKI